MKKILLTGAGAPGAPGIIHALQQADFNLTVGDCNPTATGRFLNKQFIRLPRAEDECFVSFLLNECKQRGIQALLPLVTRELLPLSKAKARFKKEGIDVIVTDADQLAIANNKGLLYQHLHHNSIPVPAFRIAENIAALQKAVAELGYPKKLVCIKPVNSNGSRGVRILQEDINQFELLFQQKPTQVYSRLSTIIETIGDKPFPPLLVSEYLPGDEFTIDTIVQRGIPKLILPRIRTRMVQGISTQGTFIRHEKIIRYCEQILQSLQLSGPIGLQVKANEDGDFRLLEINPRLQGTSVAAMGVGINLPALAVQQLYQPIEIDMDAIKWGTSFARYYSEVFYQ